jgi:hypothetical protein
MNESRTLAEAVQLLEGEQLSSVEFVQDYVQLRFDGPCLTVYTIAQTVTRNNSFIAWGEPGYRDALCNPIAHKVKQTLVVDSERLSLTFDDDSVWSVSLLEGDYRGPEALMYRDNLKQLCVVV